MRQGLRRRGAVLIVVMGVLFVLALLATTFATMQSLERQVARNYLDGMRAKLLARAGIEVGYSRLIEALGSGQLSNPQFVKAIQYFGQDNAEVGTNSALMSAPLEQASNPSLAVEVVGAGPFGAPEMPQNPTDVNFTPKNIFLALPGGTIPVGMSGIAESGTYGLNSDFFALHIRDASGMIFVNDGITESPTMGSVTRNLRRLLNHLGDAVTVTTLGDKIINNRPALGYKSKREILAVLGAADYQKAAPYITAHAWVDKKVPNPVPLSGDPAVLSYYNSFYPAGSLTGNTLFHRGSPAVYRFEANKNAMGTVVPAPLRMAGGMGLVAGNSLQNAIYGYDQLFPMWIEMTSRAPVNLNSASREVLGALMANVHGFWLMERRRDSPPAQLVLPNTRQYTSVWNKVGYSYDSVGVEGDELGFLYTSDPIKPPPTTGANSAYMIADELIACRNKAVSPSTGFNYNDPVRAPWAGPFKSWRQFYLFCDHLVDLGAVVDTRLGLYNYYNYPAADRFGNMPAAALNPTSGVMWMNQLYRRLGSQAIADAIKANFNPNLHLNEANPDENMNLMIDKTDLIVMSTEGTFVPTGYYEIESLGRVVRPQGGGMAPNAFTATSAGTAAELISEFKIEAVVKLYDAVRFTSQRDFFGYSAQAPAAPSEPAAPNYWTHTGAVRSSLPYTNNALSIEIGPEVDQGPAPEQCDWGGYIAWPTNYGEYSTGPGVSLPPKAPGAWTSMANAIGGQATCNSGINGCVMHSHFYRGDYLYHHVLSPGECRNLARFSRPEEINNCWPDPLPPPIGGSEVAIGAHPAAGPYDAFRGPEAGQWSPAWNGTPAWPQSMLGNRHRLARQFRVPPATGFGTGTLPNFSLGVSAPIDQRIDGIFLERHSTLAYWITTAALVEKSQEYRMLFSYWIKPKFYPEMSGRIREYFNWSKLDPRADILSVPFISGSYAPEASHPLPFTHYYCPSQRPDVENYTFTQFTGPYSSANHKMWPGFMASYYPVRPASMIFLNWESFLTRPPNPGPSCCFAGVSNCGATPTLNHHLHQGGTDVPSIGYPGCMAAMSKRRRTASTATASPMANQPYYLLRNPLAAGRWMHWIWYHRGGFTMDGTAYTSGIYYATPNGNPYRRILINGVGHSAGGVAYGPTTPTHDCVYSNANYLNSSSFPHPLFDWSFHHSGMGDCGCSFGPNSIQVTNDLATGMIYSSQRNLIRIGENDQWGPSVPAPYEGGGGQGIPPATRNFAPDSTIDEYYLLRTTKAGDSTGSAQEAQRTAMVNQFNQGRYHIPRDAAEGLYESPKFNLPVSGGVRVLPPPSSVAAPSGYTAVAPPPMGPGGGAASLRIIGIGWTYFGEDVDAASPNLDPVLTDYRTVQSGPWAVTGGVPQTIKPRTDVSLLIDGVWTPTYSNDWFSAVQTPGGAPWPVVTPTDLRFRVKFNWTGYLDPVARVLATPYIDDVTIFFVGGDAGFVDYHVG